MTKACFDFDFLLVLRRDAFNSTPKIHRPAKVSEKEDINLWNCLQN